MVANLLANPALLQNLMFIAPKLGISMPMIGVLVEAFNDKEIFSEGGLINETQAKVYEEKLRALRSPEQSTDRCLQAGCPNCGYIMELKLG